MADTVRVTFLFAIGQRVHWVGGTHGAWLIVSRHYREGTVSRHVEYGMVAVYKSQPLETVTAYEPDLEPLEDTAHA